MKKTPSRARFTAKLLRPAATALESQSRTENRKSKIPLWSFVVLPKEASAKLRSRGLTPIEGTINGVPFQAAVGPDGQKSHWLKINRKLSEAAGVQAGDVVTMEIASPAVEPEPTVPADLKKALAAAPKARAVWSKITTSARWDWIHWVLSAKQKETRARRVKNACSMLAGGKKRVCCFDRSGFYSKSFSAPDAAE